MKRKKWQVKSSHDGYCKVHVSVSGGDGIQLIEGSKWIRSTEKEEYLSLSTPPPTPSHTEQSRHG